MAETTTAERAYYWAAALSAVVATAMSVYMLYKMLPPDTQARARHEWDRLVAPIEGLRRRRNIRSSLVFETFSVLEALEDYALGDDLASVLEIAHDRS